MLTAVLPSNNILCSVNSVRMTSHILKAGTWFATRCNSELHYSLRTLLVYTLRGILSTASTSHKQHPFNALPYFRIIRHHAPVDFPLISKKAQQITQPPALNPNPVLYSITKTPENQAKADNYEVFFWKRLFVSRLWRRYTR